MAEDHLALGVSCIKVKTGLEPTSDIARVQAVREVIGPDVPLTIDSNCGWTIQQAKHCLKTLAGCNLLLAEQPIHPGDPAALAEVRQSTSIPIMADESVFTLQDAWLLSTHRAADILSIYPANMVASQALRRSWQWPKRLDCVARLAATSSWALAQRRCCMWPLPFLRSIPILSLQIPSVRFIMIMT